MIEHRRKNPEFRTGGKPGKLGRKTRDRILNNLL
jgi:hypothetical protein